MIGLGVLAYLIGSLPLGYWLLRAVGKDPRLASAYNIGLENTFRILGPQNTLLVGLLDGLKGFLAVWLGTDLSSAAVFGLMAYLGHLYPPRFLAGTLLRGRGAGLLLGIVFGLYATGLPYGTVLLSLGVGLGVFAALRYGSLAVLVMVWALALGSLFAGLGWLSSALLVLAALVSWRYKENLGRILEGTEPRLGQPLPLPSDKQVVCAFMIHPLNTIDLFGPARFRWLKPFVERGWVSQKTLENICEAIRPMKIGEIRGIYTADGREIRCHLLSAPLFPHQIADQPELAIRRAIQGARLAKELGCTVVGLGAFWSVVGDKGRVVQEAVSDIEVTNGGAYTSGTVKAALPQIIKHFEDTGRQLEQSTVAVVGANGVVAFGIAKQMAPLAGKLILVGRSIERLERSAASLRQSLERKGHSTDIVATLDLAQIKEADLVFTATSDPKAIILPEHIKPGTWIYDEGVPPDVAEATKQVPGVRVIPGGVVRPPGNMTSNIDLQFGPGAVPACLAETMILAAEAAFERKSLGGETKSENIQFFVERAEALGFRVVE
jgi:acyl-phosphate glycerol 3-phosphate acyltransferase